MYLSDGDIHGRLEDINFECVRSDHPFDAATQVQPCSVDLRVDNRIWRVDKRGKIDLRSRRRHDVWVKDTVKDDSAIIIKPGEMVFARVYESFTIPAGCAHAWFMRPSAVWLVTDYRARLTTPMGAADPGWAL